MTLTISTKLSVCPVPIYRGPAKTSFCISSRVLWDNSKICEALSCKRNPFSVSEREDFPLINKELPISCSKSLICLESAGCETCNILAAYVIFFSLAIVKK